MIEGYAIWKVAIICVGVFIASFIDAIGGGGGIISLPSYLIVGIPTHFSLGTNKLSSFLGTTASAFRFIKSGYVDWVLAIPSIILAVIGGFCGTSLQLMISETYLKYLLIVVLIAVAIFMLKKKEFPEEAGDISPVKQRIIIWIAAFILGMYDGFYGPGSSTFMLLVFCRLGKMDVRTASGNIRLVTLSSNFGALVTSLVAGKVLIVIGLISAAFAFVGHYLGAGVMIKNGTKIVTPVIFIVLGLLLTKIVLELCGVWV